MWLIIPGILSIVVVLGCLAYSGERKRIPQKQARFAGRPSVPLENIHEKYFKALGYPMDDFIYIWKRIGELLKLDSGKFLPADRFDTEFAAVKGDLNVDEMEDVWDFFKLEAKARNLPATSIDKVETIGDFVEALCRKG